MYPTTDFSPAHLRSGRVLGTILGLTVLITWLPVLAGGLGTLRARERLGRSEELIVAGVYRYVRHPLYAGLSLTLLGLGLVLGRRNLVLGALGWLLVTQMWSVPEERELAERFGDEYARYRESTPRLIPDVGLLIRDATRRS